MKKNAVKSKTIWVNVLLIVSSVGTALMADETFKAMVGDNIGVVGTVLGLVGILLRFSTSNAIGLETKRKHEKILHQADDDYLKDF